VKKNAGFPFGTSGPGTLVFYSPTFLPQMARRVVATKAGRIYTHQKMSAAAEGNKVRGLTQKSGKNKGYDHVSSEPAPAFSLDKREEALAFFRKEGYVVLSNAMPQVGQM
jgi:hypothetical protein